MSADTPRTTALTKLLRLVIRELWESSEEPIIDPVIEEAQRIANLNPYALFETPEQAGVRDEQRGSSCATCDGVGAVWYELYEDRDDEACPKRLCMPCPRCVTTWAHSTGGDEVEEEQTGLPLKPGLEYVLDDVRAERAKQDVVWGTHKATNVEWASILMEAVGGVARETTEVNFKQGKKRKGFPSDLRRELIQVAAIAIKWIEAIDRQGPISSYFEPRAPFEVFFGVDPADDVGGEEDADDYEDEEEIDFTVGAEDKPLFPNWERRAHLEAGKPRKEDLLGDWEMISPSPITYASISMGVRVVDNGAEVRPRWFADSDGARPLPQNEYDWADEAMDDLSRTRPA